MSFHFKNQISEPMDNDILDHFRDEEYYTGKIIAIKYFYLESQAALYAARLKEHHIKCFISNTNAITAFPLGDGGIGLHIREIDKEEALLLIKQLDDQNLIDPQNISFHEADHEDIAYEKLLSERKNNRKPLLFLVFIIIVLLLSRAYMRANGILFWSDSF